MGIRMLIFEDLSEPLFSRLKFGLSDERRHRYSGARMSLENSQDQREGDTTGIF